MKPQAVVYGAGDTTPPLGREPVRTLLDLFDAAVASRGDEDALLRHRDGRWQAVTWSGWQRRATQVAAGLLQLGVQLGDRVALIASTRAEWVIADVALWMIGAIGVPLHASLLPGQYRLILQQVGARVAIVDDPLLVQKLRSVREQLPALAAIVCFDDVAVLRKPDAEGRSLVTLENVGVDPSDPTVVTLARLKEHGAAALGENANVVRDRRRALVGNDANIVYTSGTTGRPRGAILTHQALCAQAAGTALALKLTSADRQLLFLPLSHVFGRVAYLTAMQAGAVTAFLPRLSDLSEAVEQVRPTVVVAVPRVYEKIHARAVLTSSARGPSAIQEKMARLAVRLGRANHANLPISFSDRMFSTVADATLFRRVRAALGPSLRLAICGGAPLSEELAAFYLGAGLPVLEGYGLTETAGAVTLSRPGEMRLGMTGRPIGDVEVRIGASSEVLVRGPILMRGYWEDDAATEQVLRDGWFHTGDVGELHGPFLRVTDRLKDIIVTSTGRSVAPQPLEARLQVVPWIDRAVVFGEGRKFLTALVTIRRDTLRQWAARQGIEGQDDAELSRDPRVYEIVQRALNEINAELAPAERVVRFAVLDEAFGLDSGEVTPTWKTRRRFVAEKYRAVLEDLYDRGDNERG